MRRRQGISCIRQCDRTAIEEAAADEDPQQTKQNQNELGDIRLGERVFAGMIEQAWHDVQIEVGPEQTTNPAEGADARREEALAARISAWEWLTRSPADYAENDEQPPRVSFAAACMYLGLDEDEVRRACLTRSWRWPHGKLPSPVTDPGCPIPHVWREQFIGPEDPENNRGDPDYKHTPEFHLRQRQRMWEKALADKLAEEQDEADHVYRIPLRLRTADEQVEWEKNHPYPEVHIVIYDLTDPKSVVVERIRDRTLPHEVVTTEIRDYWRDGQWFESLEEFERASTPSANLESDELKCG